MVNVCLGEISGTYRVFQLFEFMFDLCKLKSRMDYFQHCCDSVPLLNVLRMFCRIFSNRCTWKEISKIVL